MEDSRTALDASQIANIVPILPVHSMAGALAFYERLGFHTELYRGAEGYAFLTLGKLQIHLRLAPDLQHGSPCGVYLYLSPGTAADLQQRYRELGVEILSPLAVREWHMNEFMLSDPDGNLLRFGEPATSAGVSPHSSSMAQAEVSQPPGRSAGS